MEDFNISHLRNSSVAYIHQQRPLIQMDPVYQRQSGIWSVEKQQLLIDSLLNGFDVPKIYFHEFASRKEVDGRRLKYAIIDGKQRLQAIWDFLDGTIRLSRDFSYLEEPNLEIGGLLYGELANEYPDIAALLNATTLDIVSIRTDDVELIEEMFSRLNEAVPLNAPEKRNALGGPLPPAVRNLAMRGFFTDNLHFGNSRYRHWDLAAKFIYWSHLHGVADVKKFHLDNFFKNMKNSPEGAGKVQAALDEAALVLDKMSDTFEEKDYLLSQVGMVSVYYLVFQRLLHSQECLPTREHLGKFNDARRVNRVQAEQDLSEAQYSLIEFERYAQSSNDGSALGFRVDVLCKFLDGTLDSDPPGAPGT